MAKLPDFVINNFSGGLVRNKSDFLMNRNEFKNTLNLDLDEDGRAKRRAGSQQWGTTITGKNFVGSFYFTRHTLGLVPKSYHLLFSRESNASAYLVYTTTTISNIDQNTTTINVQTTEGFASSGTIEINGDIITYTGKTFNSFTGCSGISRKHYAFSPVNQISLLASSIGVDTTSGVYCATLNNLLFINGRAGSVYFDGTNFNVITDPDEPAGLFAVNYRDRIYVAGSGVADGSGTRNGDPRRVSFSDAGSPTSWDIDNYFDVEDDNGESITALSANDDNLFIFKTNSIFTYDEIQLKQQLWGIGAYNNRVVQKIGKLIYTFCPAGVFETNGFEARLISQPIQEYLSTYSPSYDVNGRTITNCFSAKFKNKYYLFLSAISKPEAKTDIVLVFDTIKRNWTIYDSFGDADVGSFVFLSSLNGLGTGYVSTQYPVTDTREAIFAGSLDGNGNFRYWRLFDNYTRNTFGSFIGIRSVGTIYPNLLKDNGGKPISTILETPFYDIGNSLFWKRFGYIRLLIETGSFNVSYKLDLGDRITDWISLGEFNAPNQRKRLAPDYSSGFRIALKITSNSTDWTNILNGIIIEDIEALYKQERRQYGRS